MVGAVADLIKDEGTVISTGIKIFAFEIVTKVLTIL